VQDWACQIGFLSEMCLVVFSTGVGCTRLFLKIAGDFLSQPPAKMLLKKIQTYGSKFFISLCLPDRNKFCFPGRTAKNCRE